MEKKLSYLKAKRILPKSLVNFDHSKLKDNATIINSYGEMLAYDEENDNYIVILGPILHPDDNWKIFKNNS